MSTAVSQQNVAVVLFVEFNLSEIQHVNTSRDLLIPGLEENVRNHVPQQYAYPYNSIT
jgi:hypothetical protein